MSNYINLGEIPIPYPNEETPQNYAITVKNKSTNGISELMVNYGTSLSEIKKVLQVEGWPLTDATIFEYKIGDETVSASELALTMADLGLEQGDELTVIPEGVVA